MYLGSHENAVFYFEFRPRDPSSYRKPYVQLFAKIFNLNELNLFNNKKDK